MARVPEPLLTPPEPELESIPVEEPESGRGRAMDVELKIMGQILRTLDDLPARACARVVAYLVDRYNEERDTKGPRANP